MNNDNIILTEASKKATKNNRKYKCPYCEARLKKDKLIDHIDKNHQDLIPKDYTAARIVFNIINKKECGHCVQCKKETKWNEDTWRYERFCSHECSQEYSKIMKQRMVNTYGKEHLLNDPQQQEKMLKGRRISGTYKFSDGGVKDYCGSYELKLLEFMDKVMNIKSDDIITPGPIIEYKFNGEKLFWITDMYYIPANLVFDVKDGGDNPNNREMTEYRDKQDAKEYTISQLNKYNYIRLTNNNFQQLLLILAEIKMSMMDEDNPDYIIRINEFVVGTMQPKKAFIVNTINNNVITNTHAFIDDEIDKWYTIMNNKLVKINPTSISEGTSYIYEYNGSAEDIYNILESNLNKEVDYNKEYFYELFTGKDMLSSDQILYDENFTEVPSKLIEFVDRISIFESTMSMINDPSIPILNYDIQKSIQEKYANIELRYNWNGYFAKNIITENTTPYVSNISELSDTILDSLNKM